jgi:hypothetical protein
VVNGSLGKGPNVRVGRVKKVVLQRCDTESITLEGDDGEMGGDGRDGEGRRERKETCPINKTT